MLDFKKYIFNEIAEPKKPINNVAYKNSSDNEFTLEFVTSLGNKVLISFFVSNEENKLVEISFYVNGSYDENKDKQEILGRDPEILPNVMYIVKNKVDELKINKIYFVAFEDDNDSKIVYNFDLNPIKQKILIECNKILNVLKNKRAVDLINKFKLIISSLKNDSSCLSYEKEINILFGDILTLLTAVQFDSFEFYQNVNELKRAFKSYTDGMTTKENRRVKVYKKLFERYFQNEWDLKVIQNTFILKRKNLN